MHVKYVYEGQLFDLKYLKNIGIRSVNVISILIRKHHSTFLFISKHTKVSPNITMSGGNVIALVFRFSSYFPTPFQQSSILDFYK